MKLKITVFIVFYVVTCFSQNIQVTYKHDFDYKLINKQNKTSPSDSQIAFAKNAKTLKKILVLNKEEAYYSPIPVLESDDQNRNLMSAKIQLDFKYLYHYNNTDKKVFRNETATGEDYIVESKYITDWKITKETRQIMGYTWLQGNYNLKDISKTR